MSFLERDNGETVFDQKEILAEVKEFYVKLYSHRNITDVDLTAMLPGTPILSCEDSELIEGSLTYAEALAALRKMKNNKSPGPDGISIKFYQIFFYDIRSLLVHSINYGFGNEKVSVTQKQGVTTCIPKDGKPKQYIKKWLPISLLNTAYNAASACKKGLDFFNFGADIK